MDYRNNADLGKGVPRLHVNHESWELLFFTKLSAYLHDDFSSDGGRRDQGPVPDVRRYQNLRIKTLPVIHK
jgi:hypothetical protein